MTIKEIKKKLGISNKDISKWFGYKNPMSYYNAKKGKTKIEEGLVIPIHRIDRRAVAEPIADSLLDT